MKGSTRLIFFALLAAVSFSCKKDKLKDEKSILVGEWEWYETHGSVDLCSGNGYSINHTPLTTGSNHSIVFKVEGIIEFRTNGVLDTSYNIKFVSFDEIYGLSTYDYSFSINPNGSGNEEDIVGGAVSVDSLRMSGHPYIGVPGCYLYSNYFVKK